MADLDPSQEAERLLDGPGAVATTPSGSPSPETPGAIPSGGPEGGRSGGAGGEDPGALQERLQRLEQELVATKGRLNDTQGAYHQELSGRRIAESMVEAIHEARRRDEQIAAQAKQMEPPAFDGEPDDPEAITKYGHEVGKWAQGVTLANLMPYISEFDGMRRTLAHVYRDQQGRAFSVAAKRAEDQGFDDFDEFRGTIVNRFSEMGPDGQTLAMDPDNVWSAYLMVRSSSGRPFVSKKRQDETPPPSLRARPSGPRPDKVKFNQVSPYASQIAKAMGFDPNTELTDREKGMLRHV